MKKEEIRVLNNRHLEKVNGYYMKYRKLSVELCDFKNGVLILKIIKGSPPSQCVNMAAIFQIAQTWVDLNPELRNAYKFHITLVYKSLRETLVTKIFEGPILFYN